MHDGVKDTTSDDRIDKAAIICRHFMIFTIFMLFMFTSNVGLVDFYQVDNVIRRQKRQRCRDNLILTYYCLGPTHKNAYITRGDDSVDG